MPETRTPRSETRRYEVELRGRWIDELEQLAAEHLYDDVAAYAAVLLHCALWEIAENRVMMAMIERGPTQAEDPDDGLPF